MRRVKKQPQNEGGDQFNLTRNFNLKANSILQQNLRLSTVEPAKKKKRVIKCSELEITVVSNWNPYEDISGLTGIEVLNSKELPITIDVNLVSSTHPNLRSLEGYKQD